MGTFNIKFINASDTGEKNWSNRKPYVAKIVTDNAYDVIALNEIRVGQQENELKQLLPDYTLISWGSDSELVKGGGLNGVAFLTAKFDLLDEGHFFLSADPDRSLKSWDTNLKRVTVYVKLRDKISGEAFYYFSTHMDSEGPIAKREGARINLEKMNEIAGHYPVFLAGDLNSNPNNTAVYESLSAYYKDSRVVTETPYTSPDGTLCKWDKNNTSSSRLDYVWSNARILTYETIWEDYGREVTPSDHFPILITCTLNEHQKDQHSFYVDINASAGGNGTKSSPFNDFATALEASGVRDTVYLTEGTYYPSESPTKTGRDVTFEINNSLLILGGYNKEFTKVVGKSVFSGDINRNDEYSENKIIAGNEENAYSVVTIKGRCIVEIQNCIISGGYANGISDKGAGINNAGPSLRLIQCELRDNYTTGSGAGIYSTGSISISDCVFAYNKAMNQGGAYYIGSNLWKNRVVNSTFSNNSANSGSAMYIAGLTEGYYSGNTFNDNHSKLYGTFTAIDGVKVADVVITNNTFANNTLEASSSLYNSLNGGAAIYINTPSGSITHLTNNTISGNVNSCYDGNQNAATNFYGATVHINQGQLNLCNNIIAGNYSTSSLGGDVYLSTGNTELLKSQYNIYTANTNMNITPGSTDFLSLNYAAGINALSTLLEGEIDSDRFVPTLKNNGGNTHTIEVLSPYYNQHNINILGKVQLNETSLKIDLDGNGIISGNIEYDQRGAVRNLNNRSTIGAFEYGAILSIENTADKQERNIYIIGDELYLSSSGSCYYELFDMNGLIRKKSHTDTGIVNIASLHPGVFLIKLKTENGTKTGRFVRN